MQVETTMENDNEMVVKRLSVPLGLEELMESLTKEVLRKKPDDIYIFASEHFAQLLAVRDQVPDPNALKRFSKSLSQASSGSLESSYNMQKEALKIKSATTCTVSRINRGVGVKSPAPKNFLHKRNVQAKVDSNLSPRTIQNNNANIHLHTTAKAKAKTDKAKMILEKRKTRTSPLGTKLKIATSEQPIELESKKITEFRKRSSFKKEPSLKDTRKMVKKTDEKHEKKRTKSKNKGENMDANEKLKKVPSKVKSDSKDETFNNTDNDSFEDSKLVDGLIISKIATAIGESHSARNKDHAQVKDDLEFKEGTIPNDCHENTQKSEDGHSRQEETFSEEVLAYEKYNLDGTDNNKLNELSKNDEQINSQVTKHQNEQSETGEQEKCSEEIFLQKDDNGIDDSTYQQNVNLEDALNDDAVGQTRHITIEDVENLEKHDQNGSDVEDSRRDASTINEVTKLTEEIVLESKENEVADFKSQECMESTNKSVNEYILKGGNIKESDSNTYDEPNAADEETVIGGIDVQKEIDRHVEIDELQTVAKLSIDQAATIIQSLVRSFLVRNKLHREKEANINKEDEQANCKINYQKVTDFLNTEHLHYQSERYDELQKCSIDGGNETGDNLEDQEKLNYLRIKSEDDGNKIDLNSPFGSDVSPSHTNLEKLTDIPNYKNEAAVKIQSTWRGHRSRRSSKQFELRNLQKPTECDELPHHRFSAEEAQKAAVIIQALFRGYLTRKLYPSLDRKSSKKKFEEKLPTVLEEIDEDNKDYPMTKNDHVDQFPENCSLKDQNSLHQDEGELGTNELNEEQVIQAVEKLEDIQIPQEDVQKILSRTETVEEMPCIQKSVSPLAKDEEIAEISGNLDLLSIDDKNLLENMSSTLSSLDDHVKNAITDIETSIKDDVNRLKDTLEKGFEGIEVPASTLEEGSPTNRDLAKSINEDVQKLGRTLNEDLSEQSDQENLVGDKSFEKGYEIANKINNEDSESGSSNGNIDTQRIKNLSEEEITYSITLDKEKDKEELDRDIGGKTLNTNYSTQLHFDEFTEDAHMYEERSRPVSKDSTISTDSVKTVIFNENILEQCYDDVGKTLEMYPQQHNESSELLDASLHDIKEEIDAEANEVKESNKIVAQDELNAVKEQSDVLVNDILDTAALKIQKFFKGIAAKKIRSKSLNVGRKRPPIRSATVVIKTKDDHNSERLRVSDDMKNNAAIIIQKAYKGYRVRRGFKHNEKPYNETKKKEEEVDKEITRYLKTITEPIRRAFSADVLSPQHDNKTVRERSHSAKAESPEYIYIPLRQYTEDNDREINKVIEEPSIGVEKTQIEQNIEETREVDLKKEAKEIVREDIKIAVANEDGCKVSEEKVSKEIAGYITSMVEPIRKTFSPGVEPTDLFIAPTEPEYHYIPLREYSEDQETTPTTKHEADILAQDVLLPKKQNILIEPPEIESEIKLDSTTQDQQVTTPVKVLETKINIPEVTTEYATKEISEYIDSIVNPIKQTFLPNKSFDVKATEHSESSVKEEPVYEYIPLKDYSTTQSEGISLKDAQEDVRDVNIDPRLGFVPEHELTKNIDEIAKKVAEVPTNVLEKVEEDIKDAINSGMATVEGLKSQIKEVKDDYIPSTIEVPMQHLSTSPDFFRDERSHRVRLRSLTKQNSITEEELEESNEANDKDSENDNLSTDVHKCSDKVNENKQDDLLEEGQLNVDCRDITKEEPLKTIDETLEQQNLIKDSTTKILNNMKASDNECKPSGAFENKVNEIKECVGGLEPDNYQENREFIHDFDTNENNKSDTFVYERQKGNGGELPLLASAFDCVKDSIVCEIYDTHLVEDMNQDQSKIGQSSNQEQSEGRSSDEKDMHKAHVQNQLKNANDSFHEIIAGDQGNAKQIGVELPANANKEAVGSALINSIHDLQDIDRITEIIQVAHDDSGQKVDEHLQLVDVLNKNSAALDDVSANIVEKLSANDERIALTAYDKEEMSHTTNVPTRNKRSVIEDEENEEGIVEEIVNVLDVKEDMQSSAISTEKFRISVENEEIDDKIHLQKEESKSFDHSYDDQKSNKSETDFKTVIVDNKRIDKENADILDVEKIIPNVETQAAEHRARFLEEITAINVIQNEKVNDKIAGDSFDKTNDKNKNEERKSNIPSSAKSVVAFPSEDTECNSKPILCEEAIHDLQLDYGDNDENILDSNKTNVESICLEGEEKLMKVEMQNKQNEEEFPEQKDNLSSLIANDSRILIADTNNELDDEQACIQEEPVIDSTIEIVALESQELEKVSENSSKKNEVTTNDLVHYAEDLAKNLSDSITKQLEELGKDTQNNLADTPKMDVLENNVVGENDMGAGVNNEQSNHSEDIVQTEIQANLSKNNISTAEKIEMYAQKNLNATVDKSVEENMNVQNKEVDEIDTEKALGNKAEEIYNISLDGGESIGLNNQNNFNNFQELNVKEAENIEPNQYCYLQISEDPNKQSCQEGGKRLEILKSNELSANTVEVSDLKMSCDVGPKYINNFEGSKIDNQLCNINDSTDLPKTTIVDDDDSLMVDAQSNIIKQDINEKTVTTEESEKEMDLMQTTSDADNFNKSVLEKVVSSESTYVLEKDLTNDNAHNQHEEANPQNEAKHKPNEEKKLYPIVCNEFSNRSLEADQHSNYIPQENTLVSAEHPKLNTVTPIEEQTNQEKFLGTIEVNESNKLAADSKELILFENNIVNSMQDIKSKQQLDYDTNESDIEHEKSIDNEETKMKSEDKLVMSDVEASKLQEEPIHENNMNTLENKTKEITFEDNEENKELSNCQNQEISNCETSKQTTDLNVEDTQMEENINDGAAECNISKERHKFSIQEKDNQSSIDDTYLNNKKSQDFNVETQFQDEQTKVSEMNQDSGEHIEEVKANSDHSNYNFRESDAVNGTRDGDNGAIVSGNCETSQFNEETMDASLEQNRGNDRNELSVGDQLENEENIISTIKENVKEQVERGKGNGQEDEETILEININEKTNKLNNQNDNTNNILVSNVSKEQEIHDNLKNEITSIDVDENKYNYVIKSNNYNNNKSDGLERLKDMDDATLNVQEGSFDVQNAFTKDHNIQEELITLNNQEVAIDNEEDIEHETIQNSNTVRNIVQGEAKLVQGNLVTDDKYEYSDILNNQCVNNNSENVKYDNNKARDDQQECEQLRFSNNLQGEINQLSEENTIVDDNEENLTESKIVDIVNDRNMESHFTQIEENINGTLNIAECKLERKLVGDNDDKGNEVQLQTDNSKDIDFTKETVDLGTNNKERSEESSKLNLGDINMTEDLAINQSNKNTMPDDSEQMQDSLTIIKKDEDQSTTQKRPVEAGEIDSELDDDVFLSPRSNSHLNTPIYLPFTEGFKRSDTDINQSMDINKNGVTRKYNNDIDRKSEPFYLHQENLPLKIPVTSQEKAFSEILKQSLDAEKLPAMQDQLRKKEIYDSIPIKGNLGSSRSSLDEPKPATTQVSEGVQCNIPLETTFHPSTVLVQTTEVQDNVLPLAFQMSQVPGQVFVIIQVLRS